MVQELEPEEEYLLPRPEAKARRAAREKFLQTIRDKTPEVLRSLAEDVLPSYRAAFDEDKGNEEGSADEFKSLLSGFSVKDPHSVYHIHFLGDLDAYGDRKGDITRFHHSLQEWAEKYHLIDYWCLDVVEHTLQKWLRLDSLDRLDWEYPAEFAGGLAIQEKVRFEFMSWDMRAETWAEYEKMFLDGAKEWLRKYHDEKLGFVRKKKLLARKKFADYHFEWLVQYQINELPITGRRGKSIISEYGGGKLLDRTTVMEAIHNLASLMDLTLRKSKRGRPRSS